MATTQNIRWYMTEEVAKALRSKQHAMVPERDAADGDVHYAPADNPSYRMIRKAHDLAFKGGQVAHDLGLPWAVVEDRLGVRVFPDALVAAVVGAPFPWQGTPYVTRAEQALAEIEARFGPVRKRVAA